MAEAFNITRTVYGAVAGSWKEHIRQKAQVNIVSHTNFFSGGGRIRH